MRSRGTYRQYDCIIDRTVESDEDPLKSDEDVKVIDDVEDMDVIDISDDEKLVNKSQDIELITIDSDEEDDIQLIDSGLDDSSTTSTTDNNDICWVPKRRTTQTLKRYNGLTSADFYVEPRIHPSVIAIELRDKTRFDCYKKAISLNKHLFENKTVLVIGSAIGLLGLFAAKAQASVVILVDRPGIQELIDLIIEKNQWLQPKTKFFTLNITEDLVLPNGLQEVDIIVSDWANHSLYFKSLINVFIAARNKFLREGGLIFPDSAQLYLAGAHDYVHQDIRKDKRKSDSLFIKRVDYWNKNVYKFDMTAIRHRVVMEPLHEYINNEQVITNESRIKTFNLYEITAEDINFSLPFELNLIKNSYLQTFVLFFEVIFSKNQTVPIMLSTRPSAAKHMFRPTIFFMDSDKHLIVNKKDKINGNFTYNLTKDLNQMAISIDFKLKNVYLDVEESLNYTTN